MNKYKLPTEDAIAEAGFRLLSKNPGAKLEEIAKEAGITRATLHRYFPSRNKLVTTLAMKAIKEMDAAVEQACQHSQTAAEVLRDSLTAMIPLGARHGFLGHEDLQQDATVQREFLRLEEETREWINAAKKEGAIDNTVPTEWCVRTFDNLLYTAWECVWHEELTTRQAAELAWRTLSRGLRASG